MATNNSINAGNETTGKVYQAKGAAAPDFSTATYPDTTTMNQILYSSAANTVSEITTGNDRLLTTDGSGVPSFDEVYLGATWTPSIEFGGGDTGITYTTQTGYYVQAGSIVFTFFLIELSSKGSDNGNATIIDLPVTVGSQAVAMSCPIPEFELTLDANYTKPVINPVASDTYANLVQCGSGQAPIALDDTNFANDSILSGMFIYTIQL